MILKQQCCRCSYLKINTLGCCIIAPLQSGKLQIYSSLFLFLPHPFLLGLSWSISSGNFIQRLQILLLGRKLFATTLKLVLIQIQSTRRKKTLIWKPSPQFVFPQFNEIYRRTFFVAEKYLLIDFLSTIAFLVKKTVQSITNFFWVDFHDKRFPWQKRFHCWRWYARGARE